MIKETKDFLIRDMPVELYFLLEKSAYEHRRSKNQEAIVVLSTALSAPLTPLKKPQRMKFKKKLSSKFISDSIKEGRE